MAWYDPFNVLDPGKSYRKAQKEYQKGWEQSQGYQKPYWQSGMDQIGKLTGAEDKLLNPAGLQDEWSSGYEMSPYAKQLQEQSMSQGLDAASSMGLLGSSSALQSLQSGASNIMQKDRENYMDDLMKKFLAGIGLGQNIYSTGAQTGGNLGREAMNFGEGNAGFEFNKSEAPMQMLMNIMRLAMAPKGGGI